MIFGKLNAMKIIVFLSLELTFLTIDLYLQNFVLKAQIILIFSNDVKISDFNF